MAWSTYGPTENSDYTRSQPSGPRARREPYPVRFRLIPWDSLRFISPGESHKFMSQSERLKTGCTDRESRETSIPPRPRAPRPRERERMGVLSLGFMDIQGDLEEMERTKRTNQKTELKEKKGNRKPTKTKKKETGEMDGWIYRNPPQNRKSTPKKEEKGGAPEVTQDRRTKTRKRTNRKTENPKKNRKSIQKEGSPEVTQDQRTKTRKAVGPS